MPPEGCIDIGEALIGMGFVEPVPGMARQILEVDPSARTTILTLLGSRATIGFRMAEHSLDDECTVDNVAAERTLYRIAQLSGVQIVS